MANKKSDAGRAGSGGKAGGKSMQVLDALRAVKDPVQDADIVSLGYVKDLVIKDDNVRFSLVLPEAAMSAAGAFKLQAERALEDLPWIETVDIQVGATDTAAPSPGTPPGGQHDATDEQENPLPLVKHVIAVGSGKGGVGKSTISVNLALALAAGGASAGILDADVYGPSVPMMLGASGHPLVSQEEKIIPMECHGVKLMSMGLLLKPDQAVVWRGPMVHGAVKQFLGDVDWGELDYLVIDLPPGTGDAPLSLAQALPLTAAVIVTTPQEVAASVAQKAMSMFERMNIRILGLIENMSYFICPHCNEQSDIFDRGGGKRLAEKYNVPFLGEIPIDIRMRKGGDIGEPVMVQFPDSELAARFRDVADILVKQLGES